MFDLPDDIAQELYEQKLLEFEETCNVVLRIHYKVGSGTFDSFKGVWTSISEETIDILCKYRENNQIGNVISSEIIDGIPTGTYKLFIPYSSLIDVTKITNYISGSLYFELRPNSNNPTILNPKEDLVFTIEFLFDREDMPLSQRYLCLIKDFK